jgi:AcrR family transcriptional regulator
MARPKESDREDIRSLVLEKAKKLFFELGYGKITIRKIAKEIGYTPGAIYLYFKNKDEILYELHNEGFRLMYMNKQQLDQESASAYDRLLNGALSYIDFALDNPELYELMFNMPEPFIYMQNRRKSQGGDGPSSEDYAMRSFESLRTAVAGCIRDGYLDDIDPDLAAFAFWSLVHGMVSLIIRKRLPYTQEPSAELAKQVIRYFMKGSGPGRT